MAPNSTPKSTDTTAVKKAGKAAIKSIMDAAPLFAGLDDYVLSQTKRMESQAPASSPQPKKKPAARVKKQVQPAAAEYRPKSVPKRPKSSAPDDPNSLLLSVIEICRLLKISRATLIRMDKAGKIPGRLKLGGSVRFHRETVVNWLQSLITSQPVADDHT